MHPTSHDQHYPPRLAAGNSFAEVFLDEPSSR